MELFVLFQGQPLLALIPAVLFACLALLARSRLGWLAAAAWAAYAIYEAGMKARIL